MSEDSARELRLALIRAGVAILPLLFLFGLQWWLTTPAPERELRLRKMGLDHCPLGRWHWLRMTGDCLCRWPEGSPEQIFQASMREWRNAQSYD